MLQHPNFRLGLRRRARNNSRCPRHSTGGSMLSTRRSAMPEFVKVAKTGDIAPGEGKAVDVGARRIALFNVDGTFYAIDDECTHRGGPLSEGMLMGEEVTCPWHGAVYDVKSGTVLGSPAPRDVARYNVRVEGEDIEVELEL